MEQLLCHLVGDYVFQNHQMANRKTSSWGWALIHAVTYTLPFLLLTLEPWKLAVICLTHAVIDRYRLAKYWVNFYGTGTEGWLFGAWMRVRGYTKNGVWWEHATKPFERGIDDPPPFLGVWLLIIVDNTAHLCINYLVLAY